MRRGAEGDEAPEGNDCSERDEEEERAVRRQVQTMLYNGEGEGADEPGKGSEGRD